MLLNDNTSFVHAFNWNFWEPVRPFEGATGPLPTSVLGCVVAWHEQHLRSGLLFATSLELAAWLGVLEGCPSRPVWLSLETLTFLVPQDEESVQPLNGGRR